MTTKPLPEPKPWPANPVRTATCPQTLPLPLLAFLLLALLPLAPALAQVAQAVPAAEPEMADALRQSGKIYVVVAAVLVIVGGLLAYLIRLDRKVTHLEREIRPK